jgi:hypothetical protein
MSDITTLMMGAAGAGGGAETDPNFNQTTLLLHGDGTNGAQNNTFLDSSSNTFTITRNGNTTQGTFSPFSLPNGEWSNYFDGANDNLSVAANAAFLYTGDFTVEMWVYPTRFVDYEFLFGTGGSGTQDQANIYANGTYVYFDGTNSVTSPTLNLNAWNHIAVTRSGTTIRAYANGVSGTSQTKSGNLGSSANAFRIGERSDGGQDFNGYISNLRVVNGTAVYTGSTYTVPTAPLTNIANTSLLTCQSNRFVDNSTNAFAITANGDPSVQPFSLFAPSAAYSPSVNGGSGYFDGTGDYLSIASNAAFAYGTGDFTWEAWVYRTTTTDDSLYTTMISDGFIVHIISGNVIVRRFGVADLITSSATVSANTWTHIAVARSGTTLSLWINGSRSSGGTTTNSTNFAQNGVRIGINDIDTNLLNGYLSSLRSIKGTALYDPTQTTITIPTVPPTDVAGTELLCNFTNAGIFDNTGKNNLETVGNAQIDTSVVKYGTGSMEFDGTGDYLFIPPSTANNLFTLGTGDFTVETWVNFTSTAGDPCICSGYADASNGWYLQYYAGEIEFALGNSAIIERAVVLSTGTWYHIAVTRASGSLRVFLDGVQQGATVTGNTSNFNVTNGFYVAILNSTFAPSTRTLNGYIDDLRITKGVARYTAAFTPPTAAFPDL